MVDADTPGFSVAERIDVIAPHPLGRLEFKDCRIPKSRLVGTEGRGFAIAMATLDVFRSTVGAAALGFARRALDEAIAHSNSRQMFGGHLADLQMTQSALGEMALDIDASALLIYRAAWKKDSWCRAHHPRSRHGKTVRHREQRRRSSTTPCNCTVAWAW